ncbi:MAG TPA: DUF1501 domain-containing protein [Phycisphaerales bacterium]|nr:DUF1501 domain-containing protein [Phycisphaerales bacterium]
MTNFDPFTRREFLRSGLIMASAAATIPAFLNASAHAMHRAMGGLSSVPGVPDDHILVVVQLSGGNDGLNTVVPFGMPEYYRARAGIGIQERDALKLSGGDGIGLHPALAPMKELYDNGLAAVIQGVGYPNPNRSHFKSMDIWHTADVNATGEGWLGRYFDHECCGFGKGESGTPENARKPEMGEAAGPPGIAIGRTAPLAMEGQQIKPVSFESAELFRWTGQEVDRELADPYQELNRRGDDAAARARKEGDSNASFLLRTALDAQVSSDLIRKAVGLRPKTTFPQSDIGRQLSMVSSMIRAGLKTRVYYTSLGSFDTHSQQGGNQGRHAQLLRQFSEAVRAFYTELKEQGNDGRVLTMSFSEFGRRVSQNASQGTDHGTAAPMFLFGPMVRQGVIGDHPSLRDLDDGDLKYKIDFRSVYAGILEGWMKADTKKILEGSWQAVPVVRKG